MNLWLRAMLCAALFQVTLVSTADAIPTFARKYDTACSTCHVGGPKKLNAFGRVFRLNGYRMPKEAEADQRRNDEIELGNPARKSLFPDSTWPGELPEAVGLSFYAQQRLRVDFETDGNDRFEAPHELEAVLAGTLGDSFSFFGEFQLFEGGDFGGLGNLFLTIDEPLSRVLPAGWLSFRIGRFIPAAEPFRDNGRRTIAHNAISSLTVGGDPFRLRSRQGGIEAFGRPTGRVLWQVGVVNGESPIEDSTVDKDIYGAVEYKLGGLPYYLDDGQTSAARPWRDDSLTLGLAVYRGVHMVEPDDPAMTAYDNKVWRGIAKLRATWRDLDVTSAVSLGRDFDPNGTGESIDSVAWLAQADYVVKPWLQLLVRYDETRIDDQDVTRTLTPNVHVFLRMNVVLRLETTIGLSRAAPMPEAQLELFYAF